MKESYTFIIFNTVPKTRPLSKIILPTSNRRRVTFGRTDQAKVGLYWRQLTPKQTEDDWIEILKHQPIIVPFTDMVKKSFVHIHESKHAQYNGSRTETIEAVRKLTPFFDL